MTDLAATPGEAGNSLLSVLAPAIVSTALDCVVVIDEEGTVVEFNPAAERTFGYRRAEVVGRPIADLIIPGHLRERHHSGMARYIKTGRANVLGRRVEIEAMRADGSTLTVELAITEVRLPDRRLFTAHIRDLTEALEAKAEIERQREALHQGEKLAALGSLLAGVAHELNNPLSIVIGQALMMREACEAGDSAAVDLARLTERSARIEAASERCARIVRTFLAMARQRASERRQVELPAVLEGAVELLAYGLRTAGIEILTDIEPSLPAIWADGDQLHQVVVNLVVNARQSLEETEGERRISLSARHVPTRGEIVLTVADTGPGVSEEVRGRIFDPFFTTKPQGVGTGVGLAVSRGIVEGHGGTLALLPARPGEGAVFEIWLPIGEGECHAEPETTAEPAPEHRPRRALIVDDEPEVGAILAELVSRHGYACDIAGGGHEAERMVAAGAAYDVILCDIRMAEGDGPAFQAWLEREAPHLAGRTGFVTGDTLGPAAHRFLSTSGRPTVEKPFGLADIARLLAELSGADETAAEGAAGSTQT